MARPRLAVIIPTKDRPAELSRLLGDISLGTFHPERIIIVDGSSIPLSEGCVDLHGLRVDFMRKVPASLTAQRNAGLGAIGGDIDLVCFFDDDVALEKDSMEKMIGFWQAAPDTVGGAAFNLTNEIYEAPSVGERIFHVNASLPGRILRSGFQSKVSCVERDIEVEWLAGCAMVWRKRLFDEFKFDEWFSGYARYEEVDFSRRVGKRYRMYIVADAKARHLSRQEDPAFSSSLGKMEVVNRYHFVKKDPGLSRALCLWGLFGLFLNNAAKGIIRADRRCALRALGNLSGFRQLLTSP